MKVTGLNVLFNFTVRLRKIRHVACPQNEIWRFG